MTAKTHLVKLLLQSNRLTLPSVDNRVISLQKRVREGGSKPWAVNSVPISLSWYGLPCLLISSSKYSTVCSHGTGRSRMHICLSPSLAWNEAPLGYCLGWWGHPSTTVGRALCVPRVVGVTQAEWQVSCPFKMSLLLWEWRNKNQGPSQGQSLGRVRISAN